MREKQERKNEKKNIFEFIWKYFYHLGSKLMSFFLLLYFFLFKVNL